jgi:hypothetical protein
MGTKSKVKETYYRKENMKKIFKSNKEFKELNNHCKKKNKQ